MGIIIFILNFIKNINYVFNGNKKSVLSKNNYVYYLKQNKYKMIIFFETKDLSFQEKQDIVPNHGKQYLFLKKMFF